MIIFSNNDIQELDYVSIQSFSFKCYAVYAVYDLVFDKRKSKCCLDEEKLNCNGDKGILHFLS